MADFSFINSDLIGSLFIREAPWAKGHGAAEDHLGGGMVYYALAYALRAELCICVGSGGGFVPRIMRQAQRDMGGGGETHLVDANVTDGIWGSPKWLDSDSFFRTEFDDIIIHFESSEQAARETFAGCQADYVHIDADHSYAGCRKDVDLYLPLLKPTGAMTLHDTMLHKKNSRCGVQQVVAELRQSTDVDIVEFSFLGQGIALVRPVAPADPL
jgi:methyltransferase family protein